MIDQGELFSIPNPCKGVCTSNSRGYCRGCLRSRNERFHWHEFSPFQQQLIANACEKRRLKILSAREGMTEEDFGEEPDQADLFGIQPLTEQAGPATDTHHSEAQPDGHISEFQTATETSQRPTEPEASEHSEHPATSESPESSADQKPGPPPQKPLPESLTPISGDQFDLF